MFNSKNSYALNKKDANAIVYIDADGNITRLTRAYFSSEEEFPKWKSWSDADYHASEKRDHVHANHTLALDELSEEAAFVPAISHGKKKQKRKRTGFGSGSRYHLSGILTKPSSAMSCSIPSSSFLMPPLRKPKSAR